MEHRPYSILLISLIAAAVQGVEFNRTAAPGGIYTFSLQETPQGMSPSTAAVGIGRVECRSSSTSGTPLDSVTYSIVGGNFDPFWLNQTTGQLSLRAGRSLDYESTTSYMFSVVCVDNNDPDENDTAVVIVSVLPVNEYAPTITSDSLTISLVVRDSTPVGTVLLSTEPGNRVQFTVEDLDDGPDGQIMFSFASQTSLLAQFFMLDPNTGALSIAQNLIGNAPAIISGAIIVCDRNPPMPECPRLTVIINITAEIRNVTNTALLESREAGTQITAVTCPESDVFQFENIVIQSVTPSDLAANFELNDTDSDSGVLVLKQPLDYEGLQPQQAINVTLTCFDSSQSPPKVVSFDVIVYVQPVNDVRPRFNQTRYDFTVDISSGVERICCVLATDGDRDVGGNVTYSLFDAQGRFSIQDNGEITFVLDTLTDKVGTTFVVQVTASDGDFSSTVPAAISVIERTSSFGVTEIIIVAVCGAAAIMIVIILLICCCCIRHYTTDSWTKKNEPVKNEKPEPLLPKPERTRSRGHSSQAKKVIKLEEMA